MKKMRREDEGEKTYGNTILLAIQSIIGKSVSLPGILAMTGWLDMFSILLNQPVTSPN